MSTMNYYTSRAPSGSRPSSSNRRITKKKGLSAPVTQTQSDQLREKVNATALFNKDINLNGVASLEGDALKKRIKDAQVEGAIMYLTGMSPVAGQMELESGIDLNTSKIGSVEMFSMRAYSRQQTFAQCPAYHQEQMYSFDKLAQKHNAAQTKKNVPFNKRTYAKILDHEKWPHWQTHCLTKLEGNARFCGGSNLSCMQIGTEAANNMLSACKTQFKAKMSEEKKKKKKSKQASSSDDDDDDDSDDSMSEEESESEPESDSGSDSDSESGSTPTKAKKGKGSKAKAKTIKKAKAKAKAKDAAAKAKAKKVAAKAKASTKKKKKKPSNKAGPDSDSEEEVEEVTPAGKCLKSSNKKIKCDTCLPSLSNDPNGFVLSLFPPIIPGQQKHWAQTMKEEMQAIMDQKLLLHEEKLKLELEKRKALQAQLDANTRSTQQQKEKTPPSVGTNNKNKSKFDYVNTYELLPGTKPADTEIDARALDSIRSTLKYSFDVKTGMSNNSPDKHRRSNIVASPAPAPGVRYHNNNNTLMRTCTTTWAH